MRRISSSRRTSGSQPSTRRALDASPTRSCSSAVPRKSEGSLRTWSRQSSEAASKAQATSSSDGVRHARRDDVVAWLVVLQHEPHRAHVVPGVAPVTARREVAEHELSLEAEGDRGRRARDLPRQEVDRPQRRLVVVEDPAAGEHPVAAAVARGDEVGVGLRDAVRRQRARRRLLRLRRLARLAEDLAGRRLVEADARVDLADRLEHRRRPDRGELRGEDRLVPRARDEGRGRQVVDLGRPGGPQRRDERVAVEEVRPDELDPGARPRRGCPRRRPRSRRTIPATS